MKQTYKKPAIANQSFIFEQPCLYSACTYCKYGVDVKTKDNPKCIVCQGVVYSDNTTRYDNCFQQ